MATSFAQIDEIYEAPQPAKFIERHLMTDFEFGFAITEVRNFNTKLRAGIVLEHTGELPAQILIAIERIRTFETREANWDSHGGRPLNDKTVSPAFRLLIESWKICHTPRLQLSRDGGIDLIWEGEDRYLEISALPDGTYDILLEGPGELALETDAPASLAAALDQLRQFCAAE